MRIVIDLNVFVSAIIARGAPADLIRRVDAGKATVVVCPRLLNELSEVLLRPKFSQFVEVHEVDSFLARLRENTDERHDPVDVAAISRDPDDDYLVALAVDAEADALVTGDRDLLDLGDPPIRILTPAETLAELDSGQDPGH